MIKIISIATKNQGKKKKRKALKWQTHPVFNLSVFHLFGWIKHRPHVIMNHVDHDSHKRDHEDAVEPINALVQASLNDAVKRVRHSGNDGIASEHAKYGYAHNNDMDLGPLVVQKRDLALQRKN